MKRGFLYSSAVFAISVVIFMAAIMASFPMITNAELSNPTMFVNDEPWYNESVYPWKMIDNQYYVPVSMFSGLSSVTIFYYPQSNSTVITYKENYISIDNQNSENAYSESLGVFKMKTMYFGPENNLQMLYVPAETVCKIFGFSFETNAKKNAVRIYDSSAKRKFSEILEEYNPIINGQDTTQATPGPDTPKYTKIVYLTFEDAPGEYMDEIVDLLNKNGYKGTFFLNGNEMLENAETVRKAIASGHSIGLHTMTQDEEAFAADSSVFLREIEEQNDLLYRVFKIKTRLIRTPEGSSSKTFKISNDLASQIYSKGYSIFNWDRDTKDLTASAKTAANNAINAIDRNASTIIRFHCEETSYNALKTVINYIKGEGNIKVIALPGLISD